MRISSKFRPPDGAATNLHRHAIAELVSRSSAARLVLVRAPSGFGKTSALRQIYEQCLSDGGRPGWITLDRSDDDLPRFLHSLRHAASTMPMAEDDRPASDLDVVSRLVSLNQAAPFTLFLDEFENVESPAVVDIVRELVDRLPHGSRLVIASRALPDIGVGRLRVRGQLLELGADQLRLSPGEIADFLHMRGLAPLVPESLALLHRRTEGWFAAVSLAAHALSVQSGSPHFDSEATINTWTGAGRAVGEYLAEEVLARQPASVREFLLSASVLKELNADVCNAVLGIPDADAMLETLHVRGLFVERIDLDGNDGGHAAYRFHPLFGNFLRAQLAREAPQRLPGLHHVASQWFEAQQRPVFAIEHAIQGGDFDRAIALLTTHGTEFLEQGRMRRLDQWLRAIPREALAGHPFINVLKLWAVLFTHGAIDAAALLEEAGVTGSSDRVIAAHVSALQPLILAMRDQFDESYASGQASLGRLPSGVAFADAVLVNCMAHVSAVMDEVGQARRLLDAARRSDSKSFNRMYSECTEGLLEMVQGRFRQAAARFRMAVDATRGGSDYSHTSGNAWAGVLMASTLYEANELDAADRLLGVYLPLARDVGLPDHMMSSHVVRSRSLFWRGDVDGATRVLTELETLGHQRGISRIVATARLERSRMLLLQGNRFASLEEMERGDDAEVWARVARQRLPAHELTDIVIARLRWAVFFGDAAPAVRQIDAVLPALESRGRIRRARKLRVFKTLALWRLGERDDAVRAFWSVLADGAQEGFLRLLVDEGPLLAGPIRQARAKLENQHGGADPVLAEYMQRLLAALGPEALAADEGADTDGGMPPHPVEALSQKEVQVLQLVAQGYSNRAIGEKLLISDSTVRTHLRSTNLKLGAENRTHAVNVARRLRLIS